MADTDTDTDTLQSLSSAQCVLLTVHYANEANFAALHAFTPARVDVLSPELVLRIVLSYVPETVDPQLYTTYVREVATRIYLEQLAPYKLDTLPVAGLSPEQAQKRANKLHLAPLTSPVYPGHAPDDLLTRFIVHRAQRIDSETGLLALVPRLVEPVLDSSDFLRTWYITAVLPLLRLRYEYYPGRQDQPILSDFEKLDGQHAIHVLMAHSTEAESPIARDIRAMVGPWMYGHTERKRRRLESNRREINQDTTRSQPRPDGFVKLDGVTQNDKTGHDWERVFEWMLHHAAHDHFPLVTNLIEDWDGPGDVDLGGFQNPEAYLDEELQAKLERQYAQAALSSCYSAEADTSETIDSVHRVLVRLAELLAFEPPPELATSVHQLPKIDQHAELLHAAESTILVKPENLLRPEHPLTTPILETYMLLQMMLYSAYQFAGLGHAISILNVAKLRFFSTEDEQLSLLSKIIHGLTARGKRDDQQWQDDYDKLLWLWDWNVGSEDQGGRGAGTFGKIEKTTIEREMLKVLISNGCYSLVDRLYFATSKSRVISSGEIEKVILDQAMQLYDNASNGNRTRGAMKKASDLIKHCQSHYPQSGEFQKALALIAATHSMSFYSLTLQHGVPFQPVNIRASLDPLALLPKLLEQNTNSYTKLDDLISIGRHLIEAGLPLRNADGDLIDRSLETDADKKSKLLIAEKRVVYMCVEAALSNADFETAYSYVVNRLGPQEAIATSVTTNNDNNKEEATRVIEEDDDDVSWRAAFLAGRYRSPGYTQPTLRRLDQRTELLSLALLLAPPASLSEVLGVWRRCEEETNALLAAETAAERDFDDRADNRSGMPGTFANVANEGMVFGQPRREVGRLGNAGAGRGAHDEAPIGLFDVARGAAKAFSRNAFPLRAGAAGLAQQQQQKQQNQQQVQRTPTGEALYEADGRVRRRDMVASAVTGGLASGIGWVLGATPVDRNADD